MDDLFSFDDAVEWTDWVIAHDNHRVPPVPVGVAGLAVHRHRAKVVPFPQKQITQFSFADAGSVLQHRVEHWLQVARRAADRLEHVGSGSLLLQGFTQLVQQPRVVDGDHRLVGEIADKLDLLFGKRTNLLAIDDDSPDQLVVLEHGHANYGSRTAQSSRHTGVWLRRAVGAMGYLLCPQDPSNDAGRRRPKRTALFLEFDQCGRSADRGGHMKILAVVTKQSAKFGLADAHRALQHGLKHWLQLTGRRADDAQHLRCGFLSLQGLVALTDELNYVGLCFVVCRGWIT